MQIYNYDGETFEYLYTSTADIDPKSDPNNPEYLIPADATIIVPPSTKKSGYAICFDEVTQSWQYIEDHRGDIIYDIDTMEEITWNQIGPIPNNYITEIPKQKNEFQTVWEKGKWEYPDLETLKTNIKSSIDEVYEDKLSVPYKCNNYYVLPNWATTYTTTLVSMQQDNEDGTLDEEYKVLLIKNPNTMTMVQITITDINDFMPYYNKVKDVYKKLATEYHDVLVKLSITNDSDSLVKIYDSYK